jgi:hypothetical protein
LFQVEIAILFSFAHFRGAEPLIFLFPMSHMKDLLAFLKSSESGLLTVTSAAQCRLWTSLLSLSSQLQKFHDFSSSRAEVAQHSAKAALF